MAAVRVRLDPSAPDPTGVEVFSLLFPVFVLGAVALAVPICGADAEAPTPSVSRHREYLFQSTGVTKSWTGIPGFAWFPGRHRGDPDAPASREHPLMWVDGDVSAA